VFYQFCQEFFSGFHRSPKVNDGGAKSAVVAALKLRRSRGPGLSRDGGASEASLRRRPEAQGARRSCHSEPSTAINVYAGRPREKPCWGACSYSRSTPPHPPGKP